MINYVLEENELTGEPKKYKAQIVNSRSYTFEDIANHLIRHNTGLSSSAIYGLWEGIKGAVEEFISEGGAINTELFKVRASIKGVFSGMDDGFDASRHEMRLNMRTGSLLRDIPKKLKVKKITAQTKAFILSVTDIKTGSVNECLTPGKNIRIIGQRVKIEGSDPSCGLFFIPEKKTEQTVKLELSEIAVNKPSEIIAVIPRLSKGLWSVRLVTQYTTGARLRITPNSLNFSKNLTVA